MARRVVLAAVAAGALAAALDAPLLPPLSAGGSDGGGSAAATPADSSCAGGGSGTTVDLLGAALHDDMADLMNASPPMATQPAVAAATDGWGQLQEQQRAAPVVGELEAAPGHV